MFSQSEAGRKMYKNHAKFLPVSNAKIGRRLRHAVGELTLSRDPYPAGRNAELLLAEFEADGVGMEYEARLAASTQ